jgi:hypothetical protein
MNKADTLDFKNDKPKKCYVTDCNNKPFGKNKLTVHFYEWVCRKHHYEYNYGIVR